MPLWLNNAMEDALNYKETYLELSDAAVFLNRHAGWFRFASRLEDHRAEVLIAHREYSRGAHVLSNNVGACTQDQWTQAHYWSIFCLACCRRMSGDVLAYLEMLTQSFNPKLSAPTVCEAVSIFIAHRHLSSRLVAQWISSSFAEGCEGSSGP